MQNPICEGAVMDIEYGGYIVETGAEVDPMASNEDAMCMHLFLSWRKFPVIGRIIGLAIAENELGLEGEDAQTFTNEFTSQLFTVFLKKQEIALQMEAYAEWSEIPYRAQRVPMDVADSDKAES